MKKKPENKIDLPISAMIDVVFLLLVFFIITYREEIIESQIHIDVPTGQTQKPTERPLQLLEIHVNPKEYLFMGNKPMPLPKLIQTLATFTQYDPDQIVVIKVNKLARHEELINLLDHCKQVGITKLNVVTLEESSI